MASATGKTPGDVLPDRVPLGVDFVGGFSADFPNELFAREDVVEICVDQRLPVENLDAPIQGLSQHGGFLFPVLGSDERDLFGERHTSDMLPPGRRGGIRLATDAPLALAGFDLGGRTRGRPFARGSRTSGRRLDRLLESMLRGAMASALSGFLPELAGSREDPGPRTESPAKPPRSGSVWKG